MNSKKPTSKVLAITLFFSLMTILGGCANTGTQGGESTEEETTIPQATPEEEKEKTE